MCLEAGSTPTGRCRPGGDHDTAPRQSIGRIAPFFMPAASPPRAAFGMRIFDPGNTPAIHLRAPLLAPTFRHADIGTRTAFGRAVRQRECGRFIEAEAPSGERANRVTLSGLNLDAPVMPATPQSLQRRASIAVFRTPLHRVREQEYSQNRECDQRDDEKAVVGHVIVFQVCCVMRTQMSVLSVVNQCQPN